MNKKVYFTQEYVLNTSPKVVYKRISTASGFAEWFAENVFRDGDDFTFVWEGSEEKARLIDSEYLKFTRFKWLDDTEEDTFFEFELQVDELTNDLGLIIKDYAYPDEVEESKKMWDSQIEELKHNLGI